MRCAALPDPAGPDLESLSAWGLDITHRYEICAARHNSCAARLSGDNHAE
jgi:hypothetical protein